MAGVRYSSPSNLSMLKLNYWAGHRYRCLQSSAMVHALKAHTAFPLGVNPVTLSPVLLKKDPSFTGVVKPSDRLVVLDSGSTQ